MAEADSAQPGTPEATPLRQLPLRGLHEVAGAKFGAFAGHDMPLFYPLGVMKEHLHTREQAGLFDISHMVHIDVEGPQAAEAIARACPFDPATQAIGAGKYTFFLNERAGIMDDLIVTRLGETRFRVVANAGCAQKDIAHLGAIVAGFDAQMTVLPVVFLALQGPGAEAAMGRAGLDASTKLAFMTAHEPRPGWFVSRSGYTGEDGFEIALPAGEAQAFAEALLSDSAVEWIGLAARDSLRMEAGLPLYGQDLDEDTTPSEAGLIWAIPKPLREGGGFIGADALTAALARGRSRKRIGMKPVGRTPVRGGAELFHRDGRPAGHVTSGGFGPSAEGPIALAMVDAQHDGETLIAMVRGKEVEMAPASLPFVAHRYKR